MAIKKLGYKTQKVTLYLRAGDWEWLLAIHGKLGASKVIRELVMGHRRRAENKFEQVATSEHQLELPITEVFDNE